MRVSFYEQGQSDPFTAREMEAAPRQGEVVKLRANALLITGTVSDVTHLDETYKEGLQVLPTGRMCVSVSVSVTDTEPG